MQRVKLYRNPGEKLTEGSVSSMTNFDSEAMPAHLAGELEKVGAMPDGDIDYSDAPSIDDWSGAVRGKYANGVAVPPQRIA